MSERIRTPEFPKLNIDRNDRFKGHFWVYVNREDVLKHLETQGEHDAIALNFEVNPYFDPETGEEVKE